MHSTSKFSPTNTPFDFTKYDTPYEVDRIEIIKAMIPAGQAKRAIDVGCGPGYFSKVLSNKGWTTTAIDTSSVNIESAKTYAAETHEGDAISVLSKIPSSHYDFAISLEVIEHMPKRLGQKLIEQLSRVLKRDGKLVISTPNKLSPEGLGEYYWGEKVLGRTWNAWDSTHVYIYSSWEIVRVLKTSGLAVDQITGYYYKGRLPVIGYWSLPMKSSSVFPFNRLGFDIILKCHKK
jgi:2-polyprenyl-3-methyl-5-hydroxy-6-metoxy-1,4-benzoquinol methylase